MKHFIDNNNKGVDAPAANKIAKHITSAVNAADLFSSLLWYKQSIYQNESFVEIVTTQEATKGWKFKIILARLWWNQAFTVAGDRFQVEIQFLAKFKVKF